MMEASYLRQGPHLAHFRWRDSSGVGTIYLEGEMGTKAVVIGEIRGEHASKMSVVEDDDLIEHLATDTPDEPLAVGILPGTARGDLHFFDAHVLDALLEHYTVDRVPIPEEIARRSIPGKRIDDLLAVHCAVGCSVMLTCTMRRRSCASMIKTKSTRKVAVGTVKKSQAMRSST
jgi:hypothetical protein